MWGSVELPDVEYIALVLENGSLVVVYVQVVRSGEEGHHGRETGGPSLPVHAISITGDEIGMKPYHERFVLPCILRLVSTNDG